MIRLVIADDRPLVRDGLRRILADHGDLRVSGEAANAGELLAVIARPGTNLVLLDTSLPGPGLVERIPRRWAGFRCGFHGNG